MEGRVAAGPSILSPPKALRRTLVGIGLAVGAYFVATYVPRFFVFTEASYTPYFWPRVSWIFPHVLAGTVAITIGPMQLWAGIRNRYRKFHRVAGRTYVVMVLLGSAAAIGLSFTAGFSLAYRSGLFFLALAWVGTTGLAFTAIRRHNFTQHREWMIRSYVVTFAFVTFRVFQDGLEVAGIATFEETSGTVAWACWAVPLLITEMVLQAKVIFAKPRLTAAAVSAASRSMSLLGLAAMLSCVATEPADEPAPPVSYPTTGSIERLDPRLDAIVPADAVIEILSEGHEWVEGPVWIPELESILYSDIPNNAVYRWSEGEEASLWLQPAGYTGEVPREGESGSNGLAVDAEGRLVLAQHGDRRLARMEAPWDAPEPRFETLAGEYEGRRFNSPNDVAVRSNGDLYFTDPPYGLAGGNEPQELDFQGVYRLAANGGLTLLTDELSRPNGIAFSPDQSILYVANSDPGGQPVVMAYDVQPDGSIGNGRVFFESWGDGMAVDQQGNVYVTGPRGGVLIINEDGEHLGTILAPPRTSNATFGEDGSTLFVTANTRLVRIRLNVTGVGF